jgi:hypothetical protein
VDEPGFDLRTSSMPTGTKTRLFSDKKAELIVKPETVSKFLKAIMSTSS